MVKVTIDVDILDLPMQDNDAEAKTIREYLVKLIKTLWIEDEGFSGKRPFGNSGWKWDVYRALGNAKVISMELDEDGYINDLDSEKGNRLILAAIEELIEKK